MIEFLSQPWPWYVGGPLIAFAMFLLLWSGGEFGVSNTLRITCAAMGGGKVADFFKFDWKNQIWNIVFAIGGIIGGVIAAQWFANPNPVDLNPVTVERLQDLGIAPSGNELVPLDVFNWSSLLSLKGFLFTVLGGFLIGFGTRYAGGCTSGHAISGLSNLQLPSLIAVIGFFVGGLIMTFLFIPMLLNL